MLLQSFFLHCYIKILNLYVNNITKSFKMDYFVKKLPSIRLKNQQYSQNWELFQYYLISVPLLMPIFINRANILRYVF